MKKYISFIAIFAALILAAPVLAQSFEIISNAPTQAEANFDYEYQVEVNNPNNINLTYGLAQSPSGMTINQDGLISWTPTNTGDFDVSVYIEGNGNNDTVRNYQNYTVTVTSQPGELEADVARLGGTNQDRGVTTTLPYEIRNTGSQPITNLEIEFLNVASRYQATASAPSSIGANSEVTADIDVFVPRDERSGDKSIGQVRITGESAGESLSITRDLRLTAENNLAIDRVEVYVDGRRQTFTSSPGVVDRDLRIDSEIEIRVRVENRDLNLDMRNVELELLSDSLRDADGRTDSISRIRSDRREELRVTFSLDPRRVDVRDSPFVLDMFVNARDDDNARHSDRFELDFDIEQNTRDLRFVDRRVSPTNVLCGQDVVRFDFDVLNTGLRDLDRAILNLQIPDLDIDEEVRNIEIDEGDTERVRVSAQLPEERSEGNYFVESTLRTRPGDSVTDIDTYTLRVEECIEEEEEPEPTPPPTTTPTQPVQPTPPPTVTPVDRSTGTPLGLEEDQYVVVLLVLILVLAIILIALAVKVIVN